MVDYATFVTRLQDLLVISPNDTDFSRFVPGIVEAAELRILRNLDPLIQHVYASNQFDIGGDTTLDGLLTMPPDLIIPRWVQIFMPSSTVQQRFALLRQDETWINDYWPDRSQLGIPKFYCVLANQVLLVAPTPNAPFIVEMGYIARPAMLSQANPQSWVASWYPDLLLYAAAVEGSGYLKNYGAASDDPQMALSWEKRYQDGLADAAIEEKRRKGTSWADVAATSVPKHTPLD